jgi:hypothetical protein
MLFFLSVFWGTAGWAEEKLEAALRSANTECGLANRCEHQHASPVDMNDETSRMAAQAAENRRLSIVAGALGTLASPTPTVGSGVDTNQ